MLDTYYAVLKSGDAQARTVIETIAKPPIDQMTRRQCKPSESIQAKHTGTTIDDWQGRVQKSVDHKRSQCEPDIHEELLPALTLKRLHDQQATYKAGNAAGPYRMKGRYNPHHQLTRQERICRDECNLYFPFGLTVNDPETEAYLTCIPNQQR